MDDRVLTSDRERRLWLWILAVMVAIYTTLGTAGRLAQALPERGLVAVSNAAVLLLVLVLGVWQWSKRPPGRREVGVTIAVAVAYWWSWIRIQTPAERTHLFEYGIVAALVYQALVERRRNGPAEGGARHHLSRVLSNLHSRPPGASATEDL